MFLGRTCFQLLTSRSIAADANSRARARAKERERESSSGISRTRRCRPINRREVMSTCRLACRRWEGQKHRRRVFSGKRRSCRARDSTACAVTHLARLCGMQIPRSECRRTWKNVRARGVGDKLRWKLGPLGGLSLGGRCATLIKEVRKAGDAYARYH